MVVSELVGTKTSNITSEKTGVAVSSCVIFFYNRY